MKVILYLDVKLSIIILIHLALYIKKGLSKIGEPISTILNTPIDLSYTLTILTTLNPNKSLIIDLRSKSNTQWDFANFIVYCIEQSKIFLLIN